MRQSYERAKKILMSKQEVLYRIARILLEKDVIDGDQLRRFLKEETVEPTTQRRRKRPKGVVKKIH